MLKEFILRYLFANSFELTMQIRQTVKENNNHVKNVYQKHFNCGYKPEGLILAEMEIGPEGKIISVEINQNDFDKAFEKKITESIKKWSFHNVHVRRSIRVEVPFYFGCL